MSINIKINARAAAVHISSQQSNGNINFPLCGAPGNTPDAARSFRPVIVEDAATCKRCISSAAASAAVAPKTTSEQYDGMIAEAATKPLVVGSRVRRRFDGKIGEVTRTWDAAPELDVAAHFTVDIDGEEWSGTREAWIELCADCDELNGFGHFAMYCVDCSGDVLFIAERDAREKKLIDDAIAADELQRAEQISFVREQYGDEAADMIVNGWTIDGALSHVDGTCDVTICTHSSHVIESVR